MVTLLVDAVSLVAKLRVQIVARYQDEFYALIARIRLATAPDGKLVGQRVKVEAPEASLCAHSFAKGIEHSGRVNGWLCKLIIVLFGALVDRKNALFCIINSYFSVGSDEQFNVARIIL